MQCFKYALSTTNGEEEGSPCKDGHNELASGRGRLAWAMPSEVC